MTQSFYEGDKCKTIFLILTEETQAQNTTILANHQCEKHSSSSQSPDEKQHSASQSRGEKYHAIDQNLIPPPANHQTRNSTPPANHEVRNIMQSTKIIFFLQLIMQERYSCSS
jgi:hypothetical protein